VQVLYKILLFVSVQSFTLLQETSLISDGEEPRQYKLLTASETAYIYTRFVDLLDSGWVQIGYRTVAS
jgi:hypothetical protein